MSSLYIYRSMSGYSSTPKPIGDLLLRHLRENGLETPLLQHRLINSWDDVVGPQVSKYTSDKFIKNQTLYVKVGHAALRADLMMMRKQLVGKLNDRVQSQIITDIRFY